MMKDELRRELEARFGDRASFVEADLLAFARDASVAPPPIKYLFKAKPDAVFTPRTPDDLVWLAAWATKHKVPLTPRGSGSTWLGGAVPIWGGVVVDMRDFSSSFVLDEVAQTVRVDAGTALRGVDERLRRHGYALRIVPSTLPNHTVGGWVAHGGSGVGSLAHGGLLDNVLAAEVVLPTGDVREFRGGELDVIAEANGTTGFITKVTLAIRAADDAVPVLATFPTIDALEGALASLPGRFPFFAVHFRTPEWHGMRNELKGKKVLPDTAFSALFVLAKKDHAAAAEPVGSARPGGASGSATAHKDALLAAIKAAGGAPLDDKKAQEEWDDRFWPLQYKLLGPSAIVTEAVIPAAKVGEALRALKGAVPSEWFGVEGMLVEKGRAQLFTFALEDERRPPFPLAFGPQLHVLAIAKKLGGHGVGTGIFQASHHKLSLDAGRVARLANFKNAVDPKVIMNPGKVFMTPLRFIPKGLARVGMKQGQPLPSVQQAMAQGAPILKMLPKMPGGSLATYRRAHQPRAWGVASDRVWFRAMGGDAAEKFGYQVFAQVGKEAMDFACPTWKVRPVGGHGPSERVEWMRNLMLGNLKPSAEMVEGAHWCTSCGACTDATGGRTDGRGIQEAVKATLVEAGVGVPRPIEQLLDNALTSNNHFGADGKMRDAIFGQTVTKKKGQVLLWLDCATAYRVPRVAKNLAELFSLAKVDFCTLGSEENCAGGLLFRAGLGAHLDDLVAKNIKAINATGAQVLVTPSSDAYLAFTRDYADVAKRLGLVWTIKVQHSSQVLAQLLKEKKLVVGSAGVTVAFHDAEYLARVAKVTEEPRTVLVGAGATVREVGAGRSDPLACGAGAGFEFAFHPASEAIAVRLFAEMRSLGTKTLVTSCTQCETHLAAASAARHAGIEVLDLSDVVLAAAKHAPTTAAPVAH